MSETKRYRYTHSDKKEMLAFVNGHLMAAALKDDNKDVIKLYRKETTSGADDAGRTASRKIANELLFAIVIGYIDNDDLVSHLATTYPGEGYEAMNYIKSCFDNGDQDVTAAWSAGVRRHPGECAESLGASHGCPTCGRGGLPCPGENGVPSW